jgi:hypothetical protein
MVSIFCYLQSEIQKSGKRFSQKSYLSAYNESLSTKSFPISKYVPSIMLYFSHFVSPKSGFESGVGFLKVGVFTEWSHLKNRIVPSFGKVSPKQTKFFYHLNFRICFVKVRENHRNIK